MNYQDLINQNAETYRTLCEGIGVQLSDGSYREIPNGYSEHEVAKFYREMFEQRLQALDAMVKRIAAHLGIEG